LIEAPKVIEQKLDNLVRKREETERIKEMIPENIMELLQILTNKGLYILLVFSFL